MISRKLSSTKAILLAVLVLLGMIVSPVLAEQYSLTGFQEFNVLDVQKDMFTGIKNITFDQSATGKAITLVHFKVPMDHTVQFTLYYGTGNTVSGYATTEWNTSFLSVQTTTSTINFNGETKSYSYFDTNPDYDYFLSGYARKQSDNSTGIIVYNAGYGSFDNDLAIYKSVPNIASNLIYKVTLSSDVPFDADISYGTASEVAASVSKDILDIAWDWMNLGISIALLVWDVVIGLLAWLKFFFIDNLLMTVALYLAISMAYAAGTSRNIFKFFQKFFNDQRKLFEFILGLWKILVDIISSFRGIFRL